MLKRDTCMEDLKKNIQDRGRNEDKTFEECGSFIKKDHRVQTPSSNEQAEAEVWKIRVEENWLLKPGTRYMYR